MSNSSTEESYESNESVEELGFIALGSPTKKITFSDKITIIHKKAIETVPEKHVTISDFVTEFDDGGTYIQIPTIIEDFDGHQKVYFKEKISIVDERVFLSFER